MRSGMPHTWHIMSTQFTSQTKYLLTPWVWGVGTRMCKAGHQARSLRLGAMPADPPAFPVIALFF